MLMEVFAWIAAVLVFICFFMKMIVPLRAFAIAGNAAFIAYGLLGIHEGLLDKVLPILVLHAGLLPLNIVRLREFTSAVKQLRGARRSEVPYGFLVPFMDSRSVPAGNALFHKGDRADFVYVLKSGRVSLPEFGKILSPGALFGEVAVFSEEATRTATARCETDCELLAIAGEKLVELFHQDRDFSFKIARLLAGYA